MATGKNISNLPSTMQLITTALTLAVEENVFKKILFQTIINYVNKKLEELTGKYITYQGNVDYIKNSYKYINDEFIFCNDSYKDIFNSACIDKINTMIININKYIDELYAIINKVVPMTDQVTAYMSLITHIEETYKLDDFSNLVEKDGSLDKYKTLLESINTEINNLLEIVKSNYNNLIDNTYTTNINSLSGAISAANNINTDLSTQFNITHAVISAYYADVSPTITKISNDLSVCKIPVDVSVYFKSAILNNNLSIQVDSISSITSISILFKNINDISSNTDQPFATISVIRNSN